MFLTVTLSAVSCASATSGANSGSLQTLDSFSEEGNHFNVVLNSYYVPQFLYSYVSLFILNRVALIVPNLHHSEESRQLSSQHWQPEVRATPLVTAQPEGKRGDTPRANKE